MASEQVETKRTTDDEGVAGDLVDAVKDLVGIGDADDDHGDERAADEPDHPGAGVASEATVGVTAGAGVGGGLHGTVDGTGASAGAGVDGSLDTGLGNRYEGSADGDVGVDLDSGAVEGSGEVSVAQEDLYGRLEGEVDGDVRFGPTSFGAGAGASVTHTDPLGIDTQGVSGGGSYHHDVDAGGVEAGVALEGTVDTWAGDAYHGEAEADVAFGEGALDVDGSASLTHTAPFGVASESFEAEGHGHVDGSGWDVEGDVGYELDVGGGAPEVAVGGGFSTTGEWSDAEDAAEDAGDAAQGAYDDAEDAVGGAAEDAGDAAGGLFG